MLTNLVALLLDVARNPWPAGKVAGWAVLPRFNRIAISSPS